MWSITFQWSLKFYRWWCVLWRFEYIVHTLSFRLAIKLPMYDVIKVCKCMYFCMNCSMPFFLFLPSPLYLSLLIQQSLLILLPPPFLFLLPSFANAVSLAANTATDVNSSSSFASSASSLLWFSHIACLIFFYRFCHHYHFCVCFCFFCYSCSVCATTPDTVFVDLILDCKS